jgi:predicted AAA+ superfamily ATPase
MDADAKLLENLVAIEIKRRGYRLCFAKDTEEIDFYIEEEDVAIQVAYSLSDPEVEKREVASLLRVNKKLGAKKLLFLTAEEDRVIEQDGNRIIVKPIQHWLLEIN